MILVDTSVWVDHLRRRNSRLVDLLDQGQAGCHPFVIGELALGGLKHRARALDLLAELPIARTLSHQHVLVMVEERALSGSGIGWVDAHLLASALVERWPLWTLDRQLDATARRLGVA